MIGRTPTLVSFLLNARSVAAVLFLPPALLAARPGGYSVESLKEGAPVGFAEPVRGALSPSGLRILESGQPLLDFWFRSALPVVEAKPEKGVRYPTLPPGALVGVVRVHRGATDFRAQKLAAGLYTMRYAVQPDDGDHQEMTEARDFLLLSAAADDLSPDALELKPLIKQSATLNGKKHPAVLFLGAAREGARPGIRSQVEPPQVQLDVDVPDSAGKAKRLTIVVVGKYKE